MARCAGVPSLAVGLLVANASLGNPVLGQLPAGSSEAEVHAAEAIKYYYDSTVRAATRQSLITTGDTPVRPPECRGTTLWECFGGDLFCAWRATWCDTTPYGEGRRRLLDDLDALSRTDPTSTFIVGQVVDFALKDGDAERAWRSAVACGAATWWCQALRGYVLHTRGDKRAYVALDSARTEAPADARAWGMEIPLATDRGIDCEWHDVGHLIEDTDVRAQYERWPCGKENPVGSRYWFLSDPLWSAPGNARHVEHIIRNIRMRLLYQAEMAVRERPPGVSEPRPFWPQALQREWTRTGFYNSWRTRVELRAGNEIERSELYVHGGYSFGPDGPRMLHPEESRHSDWLVRTDGIERIPQGVDWHDLQDYQAVVLRRGTEMEIVTAGNLPVLVDSDARLVAALAVADPDRMEVRISPAHFSPMGVARATVRADTTSSLASLEIRGEWWQGRARHGVRLPPVDGTGFGLSDPVLVSGWYPGSLVEDVIRPSSVVRGPVGVYFEAYGLEQGEPVELRIVVQRTDRTLLRRLVGALGFGAGGSSSEVSWSASASPEDGVAKWAVDIDFGRFERGSYQVVVQVVAADRPAASSSRAIEIEPDN